MTFTKLKSGTWRAQVRRKGKYVNETFLRRKDAEEWLESQRFKMFADRQLDRRLKVLSMRLWKAEMTEAIGAAKSERTERRLGYRSGYYDARR